MSRGTIAAACVDKGSATCCKYAISAEPNPISQCLLKPAAVRCCCLCSRSRMQALLPALTHHPKLSVLRASDCSLSDAAGLRFASLIKAQAASAAQAAWARTLRTGSSPSSCRKLQKTLPDWSLHALREPGLEEGTSAPCCAGSPGVAVLDLSCNQVRFSIQRDCQSLCSA